MIKTMTLAALVGILSMAVASDANAWSRSGSFSGPRGTTTTGGSGGCSGGSCSWSGGGTGPAGQAWSRQGTATCAGGSCTVSGQGTGVRGRAYGYYGAFYR